MKKLLLSTALSLGLVAPALAQVNFVPQIGVNTANIRANTYSATAVKLVPVASATDIMCLNGSTSKNVHLRKVAISGRAGTAINTEFLLNLNHSLDTGGTSPTGLELPVPVPINPNDPAATATTTSYTANPTVNDTTPNLLFGQAITLATATGLLNGAPIWQSGTYDDFYDQGYDIPKAATVVQQICINLNGVSVSSGVVNITFVWTED